MNSNLYRIIRNEITGQWVVASELAKTGKKRNSVRRKAIIIPFLSLCSSVSFALPTGSAVVSGQVSISSLSAGHLQINQSNQNAIINWQSFSIGAHETVNIQQPNANAVQLDRVVGQDPSVIQGRLNANGQVFLVNPNGVLFSNTAQVDVGGLVASTHSISNADFANGKLHFTQDGAKGSVINQGQINTPNGGVVVLIGEQVENAGTINTPQGSTVLAAGKTVDLDMKGDGLVEVKVTEAALNAQINNNGVIQADGGQIIMTAQSASQLLKTVINNEGVVEARGLVEKNGSIVLSGGDNGMVQVGGTLDVSGQAVNSNGTQGGTITVSGAQIQVNSNAVLNASGDTGGGAIAIGDKQSTNQATIQAGANLDAQTLDHGNAGTITVFANMSDGAVSVAGQLNASAPKQGDGSSIETSAAQVKIADTANITTKAPHGKSGTWLIDPADFTIGPGLTGTVTAGTPSADISGATLSAALVNGAVTILSSQGSTANGSGNINVNDAVSWSANTILTLTASNNVNVNANISATGASAGLAINGSLNLGGGASISLPNVSPSSTVALVIGGTSYYVINSPGVAADATGGAATLQGMAATANLANNYALGSNITTGFPFIPIGNLSNPFTGSFNGLGHTITGLTIHSPSANYLGLFGYTTGSSISNIGLVGVNITGHTDVGGLAGWNNNGEISNSYVTGSVSGNGNNVGGLVGYNNNDSPTNYPITNSYVTGTVTGSSYVGGLVGYQVGNISNSYAAATVTGSSNLGGLVGWNASQTYSNEVISNSYATGSVNGTGDYVGGLVGENYGAISNSYASGSVSGNGSHVGGLVGYNHGSITNSHYNTPIGPSSPSSNITNPAQQPIVAINGVIASILPQPVIPTAPTSLISSSVNASAPVQDKTEEYTGYLINPTVNILPAVFSGPENEQIIFKPTLKIKNSAGRIKRMQMDPSNQYLSLLLDNGEVRIWDFRAGVQRQIATQNANPVLTDISAVSNKGETLSVASKTDICTYDIVCSTLDDQLSIDKPITRHFTASNDGNLLLVNSGLKNLGLWDNTQSKKLWDLPYQRGEVSTLAMSDDNRYAAVLSQQSGTYVLPRDLRLQTVTDAVDIVNLSNGQVIKSLPNLGEQVVYVRFKDNDTLHLGLASGELLDWPITTDNLNPIADFAETISTVDVGKNTYAYILNDGTVRVGNGQGHTQLSLQNINNPFIYAKLLEGDKKLLTAMENGEISLWDVATGAKMLRLFSTKQGWTAMDAFGRFDGSEEALDNFSWTASQEDIPLDSFSENYYEPGLVGNVLRNQDYLNRNPLMVKEGITLPPKLTLQLDERHTTENNVVAQLDVYDRGGGIKQINIYQNGKLLNNENVIASQQNLSGNKAEHRLLALNVMPTAGKNTLKVIASNNMGIENSSTELSFDSQIKAAISPIHILTVGIDNYSDNALDLDYSVADANAIGQAIKNNSRIATSKNLYNENATKPRILAELKEFSQGNPQDTLIIYFAGHGLAIGKEWYFLPYETKMQPTPEQVAVAGISTTELKDIFKDAKMQHIIVMIDSCYSGQATDSFNTLQIGQHYFTRSLSRSLGITMITSAAKDKEAYEARSLGHGLFSYLMSQDIEKPDANHSAHGVAEYIVKTLPAFSKKIVGVLQEPVIYTKGNNFMLTGSSSE